MSPKKINRLKLITRKRSIDAVGEFFFVGILIVSISLLVVPILLALLMSFDGRQYLGTFPPPNFSFQWYKSLFGDELYMSSLRNSVIIALANTTISCSIGVTTAFALNRYDFRGKGALETFFMSPMIVPGVILGFSLLIYFSTIGIFGGIPRLITAHVIITLPYTIRVTLASLIGVPSNLVEAAMSLGATERNAFFDITVPLARPGILSSAVFALALSMDEVAASIFLVDPFSMTLPIALLANMRNQFDLTVAAASGLLILFTAAIILIVERLVGLDRVIGVGVFKG